MNTARKSAEGAVNKPLQLRKTIGSKTSLLPIRTILCCAFQIAVTSIGSKSMKCRLVRASRADGPLCICFRSRRMKKGIIAVKLDEEDYLAGAAITDGQHDVMLFSDCGKAVRFSENDVRAMGRGARGVRGMQLEKEQRVIAMLVAENEQQSVLIATENGFGKRTPVREYARHGRGTKGMIAIRTTPRNG